MSDWDPALYLEFAAERARPAADLVEKISLDDPKRIVDLGCGAGVAPGLRKRWSMAEIIGVDNSAEMIAAARTAHPNDRYDLTDIESWAATEPVDLVYSNAALQWVPNHRGLFPRLMRQVKSDGALAVQMPNIHASPLHAAAGRLLRDARWDARRAGPAAFPDHEPVNAYRGRLAPLASRVDIWETEYLHSMPDHGAILDWFRATGLRPYLDSLADDAARAEFKSALLTELPRVYAQRTRDGASVQFPFRRFFVVAYRA